jgi:uroporphyrinogen decarboxylase
VDPALLAAPWPVLERHLEEVVEAGRAAPAHVLNLGHGVPPDTDPGVLTRIVEWAHSRP